MKKYLFFLGLFTLFISSCTPVTSTNVPGSKMNQIPKNLRGKYELVYPGDLGSMMDESEEKTIVTFASDGIIFNGTEGDSKSKLNDSLFVSKIGKQIYIALGSSPDLNVFKVVKKGKEIELYPMYCMDYVSQDELKAYFSNVEEVVGEPDENGEPGMSTFVVTIDDKRLDSYFESDYPSKDPFKLVKTK